MSGACAASKQARRPANPRRAPNDPKSQKRGPADPRRGLSVLMGRNLHGQRFPPALGLRAPKQAGCGGAQGEPKLTRNGVRWLRDALRSGLQSVFMGRIHLGNLWAYCGPRWRAFSPFCGHFGLFGRPPCPTNGWKGKNAFKNPLRKQRIWQKDQQVTGNDTKVDPKVAHNWTN